MIHRLSLAAALALAATVSAQADQPAASPTTPAAKQPFESRPALYPIGTCIVSGEALDADAVTFAVDGTTFKTCCDKCKAKVEKDTAVYRAKLADADQKAQLAHYPLTTCTISGEQLGSMGAPVQRMLEGTLVQLCCKSCVKKANANAHAMAGAVIAAAHAAQRAAYPIATCLVSGEPLGDDAKDVMFGTLLVRFCCAKCIAGFEQEPAQHLAKLPAAAAKEPAKDSKGGHGEQPGK